MRAMEAYITGLVGPPIPGVRENLLGRHSAIRKLAENLGEERYLPEPPPMAQDATIAREMARAAQASARVNRAAKKASRQSRETPW